MSYEHMTLNIMTPEQKRTFEGVQKIVAEAQNGSFCLKPRHIDYVAVLVPGILNFMKGETETFMAINTGILIKQADNVLVSVRHAIEGDNLDDLERVVHEEFYILDKKEQETQIALEQLQADFIRRFVELQKIRN
jgi:F-type H+-transporting ATPase subunit epsilon